ncbi:PIG-L deacetylase family protein [Deinococcus maricopensis]|uniref:LmbE family protein n=1 Tax=Deinococcus maricopensis (strain DSM 21211 / LMG 22137 / NRRL B-23946 / LB-34) TaxID=709986 RepID=E8U9D2_DEIML|nr:PIG-L deacetylase family protein [Deinococcus maricopensis]ADV67671.1 LmbE family protein [Deinococcus maricopensis DSM 21211]
MTQQATIMAVFAHPDDEAFSVGGTLAHYAKRGVKVVLVCATRGEAGKITDPSLTIEDLGRHREEELRRACDALGIPAPTFLDYHDSGRYERTRYDDPVALMNVNPLDVEVKLRALIEQHRPQVLLTFDPHGGYGHVDHLQMHRAATAAFFSTGHLNPGPQRLFFTALTTEAAEGLSRMGQNLDPLVYGVSHDTVACVMPVGAYREQKIAALAAHGSQMGPNSVMGRMSAEEREAMQARMLDREGFSLGGTRLPVQQYPLRGLFDGIPGFETLDE